MPESLVRNLKEDVYRVTAPYFVLLGFGLIGVGMGPTIAAQGWSAVTWPQWLISGATGLLMVCVRMVSALPGDHLKAVLVYWRIKNPLPGARAFSQRTLESDPRISKERLRTRLGGKLPRGAIDQNKAWFQLYQTVKTLPEVLGAHFEYLLFRDLTWLTTLMLVVAVVGLGFNHDRWRDFWVFALLLVVLDLLLMRAGASRGNRFVRTVLAIASHN